jgi:hypothetical protein
VNNFIPGAIGVVAKLSPRLIAALLTRMSMPPHFSTNSRVSFFIRADQLLTPCAEGTPTVGLNLFNHYFREIVAGP